MNTSSIDHFLLSANNISSAVIVIHLVEDRSNIAHSAVWCDINVDPFCEMPNRDNMFTRRFAWYKCSEKIMIYYTNKNYLHTR